MLTNSFAECHVGYELVRSTSMSTAFYGATQFAYPFMALAQVPSLISTFYALSDCLWSWYTGYKATGTRVPFFVGSFGYEAEHAALTARIRKERTHTDTIMQPQFSTQPIHGPKKAVDGQYYEPYQFMA